MLLPLPKATLIIATYGKVAIVERNGSGKDWNIRIEGEKRVRFGNEKEIKGDISHFQTYGLLPWEAGQHWQ